MKAILEAQMREEPVSKPESQQIDERRRSVVVTNGIWNAFGNAVNTATGILGSLIVVRTLTPSSYGTLSYYLWLSSILVVLALLAFPYGHTKVVSELHGEGNFQGANQLSACITGMVGIYSGSIAVTVGIYAFLYQSGIDKTYLLIVAAMLVPSTIATMFGSRLAVSGRYRWSSIGVQISSLLQLGILICAMMHHWGPAGYALGLLSPGLFQMVFLFFGNRDSMHIYRSILRFPNRVVLRRYIAFVIPMTLVVLYERIIWDRSEIFFLKLFSSSSEIGYYNLAYTTFGMFLNVGLALINGYWPAISKHYGAGELKSIRHKVGKGVILSTMYAVPLACGGVFTLKEIISIAYGVKMEPAANVAIVLMIGLIPGVINGMFSLTLSACGLVWTNVKIGLVTSVISLILDDIFVRQLGAEGGAIGCVISQTLNCCILLIVIVRKMHIKIPLKEFGVIWIIGLLTTGLAPAILNNLFAGPIAILASVIFGGILYVACIWKFGFLNLLRQ